MSYEYDITDNVDKDFNFKVEGKVYIVTYPLMEDIEQLQNIADKQREAQKEKDEELSKSLSKELEGFIYNFIRPESEEGEDIRSVMKRQNILVVRNFNKMIQKQFGIE